jgi:hypothetical protein
VHFGIVCGLHGLRVYGCALHGRDWGKRLVWRIEIRKGGGVGLPLPVLLLPALDVPVMRDLLVGYFLYIERMSVGGVGVGGLTRSEAVFLEEKSVSNVRFRGGRVP